MADALEQKDNSTQYLSFRLGKEEYAVDVLKVQEIRSYEEATRIPHTPEYVAGIINLRGAVVPIIDLRRRFELPVEIDFATVNVLVKVNRGGKERTIGLVVDSVSEVYEVTDSEKQPAPEMGGTIANEFIESLATLDDRLIILLNIDYLMNEGILEKLDQVAAEG